MVGRIFNEKPKTFIKNIEKVYTSNIFLKPFLNIIEKIHKIWNLSQNFEKSKLTENIEKLQTSKKSLKVQKNIFKNHWNSSVHENWDLQNKKNH